MLNGAGEHVWEVEPDPGCGSELLGKVKMFRLQGSDLHLGDFRKQQHRQQVAEAEKTKQGVCVCVCV